MGMEGPRQCEQRRQTELRAKGAVIKNRGRNGTEPSVPLQMACMCIAFVVMDLLLAGSMLV
jgi:hypothetical protein